MKTLSLMLLTACCGALTFEAADVHPGSAGTGMQSSLTKGRYELRHASLLELIVKAWDVEPEAVSGGPAWLASDRFDVIAKAPPEAGREELVAMAAFAAQIRRFDEDRISHPVADLTELKGTFDFSFQFATVGTINDATAKGLPVAPSILDALGKLGLKLESRKAPYPVLFVDCVSRVPTPNAPDVTKYLPAAETEFEAADIKPSKATARKGKLNPGGRLDLQGYTLKDLIEWGFDLTYDDDVADCPKWITTARYDIVAKAPESKEVDVTPMIRSLIVERFRLQTHTEERVRPYYALVAGKNPKLKEADASGRSECRISVGEAGRGGATAPLKVATCTNTTMAELAQRLHSIGPAYVDRPVADQTGMAGAYDLALSFTTKNIVTVRKDPADDPSGAMTLFEALEKELGLKLDGSKKTKLPVLVVDHAEQIVE